MYTTSQLAQTNFNAGDISDFAAQVKLGISCPKYMQLAIKIRTKYGTLLVSLRPHRF